MPKTPKKGPRLVAGLFLCALAAPATAACDPAKPVEKPTDQYEIQGNRVYDKKSRLTWQRCSVGQTLNANGGGGQICDGPVTAFSMAEAALYAEEGWRIPTQNELATLVSPSCFDPAINEEVFPNMDPDVLGYWSRTFDKQKRVWYINFVDGSFRTYSGTTLRHALRLVKD
ncbi:MAG: DUF1566 domain-containing protein [Rhodospirillaceae bacterium]